MSAQALAGEGQDGFAARTEMQRRPLANGTHQTQRQWAFKGVDDNVGLAVYGADVDCALGLLAKREQVGSRGGYQYRVNVGAGRSAEVLHLPAQPVLERLRVALDKPFMGQGVEDAMHAALIHAKLVAQLR